MVEAKTTRWDHLLLKIRTTTRNHSNSHKITVITARPATMRDLHTIIQTTTSLKTSNISSWTKEIRNNLTSSRRSSTTSRETRSLINRRQKVPHAHLLMKAQVAVVKEGLVRQTMEEMAMLTLLSLATMLVQVSAEIMIFMLKTVNCLLMFQFLSRHHMSKSLKDVVLRILLVKSIYLKWQSSWLSFLVCQSSSNKLLRTTLSWLAVLLTLLRSSFNMPENSFEHPFSFSLYCHSWSSLTVCLKSYWALLCTV